MNKPTISIIIPVYNIGPYLRQCLDGMATMHEDCVVPSPKGRGGNVLRRFTTLQSSYFQPRMILI